VSDWELRVSSLPRRGDPVSLIYRGACIWCRSARPVAAQAELAAWTCSSGASGSCTRHRHDTTTEPSTINHSSLKISLMLLVLLLLHPRALTLLLSAAVEVAHQAAETKGIPPRVPLQLTMISPCSNYHTTHACNIRYANWWCKRRDWSPHDF
jgi:hypothetical protein